MHIKITNGIPEKYSIGQLRRDNKNVSFPKNPSDSLLANWNVYPYTVDTQPEYDKRTQRIEAGSFDNSTGSWVQTWNVVDKTAEEISQYDAEMVAGVKAEAQRRILEILPEWKQRNLTARAAELAIKGVSNWTAEETSEYEAGQAVWDRIKAIRAASDALEAQSPIPENFSDDSYWS